MDLLKKLRLNTAKPLWLINAPADCAEYFTDFKISKKLGKEKPVPQLLLFTLDSGELHHYLSIVADHVGHETVFWILYPKKSGAISSDLIQMKHWQIVTTYGYRGQTSVSLNDDWSGIRFTNAPRTKPSDRDVPITERKTVGIDYVQRTVQLPPDAHAALQQHKGLSEYFYAQSFTCKKEYAISIIDAKKPETRTKRIEKMIEMLLPKMHAKQLKKK